MEEAWLCPKVNRATPVAFSWPERDKLEEALQCPRAICAIPVAFSWPKYIEQEQIRATPFALSWPKCFEQEQNWHGEERSVAPLSHFRGLSSAKAEQGWAGVLLALRV